MKTRIFQTRFYKDKEVLKLSLEAQHLFMYLLTCEHINICGIFELPDPYIILESKLTQEQLDKAKKELQDMNKVIFEDSWVFVVNARKNNNYEKSEDNMKCLVKELLRVPKNVMATFDKYNPYESIDTTVDTTVKGTPYSNYKQETINNKSKTRTKKQEKGKKEVSNTKPQDRMYQEAEIILSGYNTYFNKKFKNIDVWFKNFVFWRKTYSLEEIQDAILNAKKDSWWKDKLTLEKLFRTKNKNGECDYIGELLNK